MHTQALRLQAAATAQFSEKESALEAAQQAADAQASDAMRCDRLGWSKKISLIRSAISSLFCIDAHASCITITRTHPALTRQQVERLRELEAEWRTATQRSSEAEATALAAAEAKVCFV